MQPNEFSPFFGVPPCPLIIDAVLDVDDKDPSAGAEPLASCKSSRTRASLDNRKVSRWPLSKKGSEAQRLNCCLQHIRCKESALIRPLYIPRAAS